MGFLVRRLYVLVPRFPRSLTPNVDHLTGTATAAVTNAGGEGPDEDARAAAIISRYAWRPQLGGNDEFMNSECAAFELAPYHLRQLPARGEWR